MISSLRSSLTLALWPVLLCSSFLLAANVEIGDSQEVVQRKLGKPTGLSSEGNQTTFFYKNGKVEFSAGRAVNVYLLSDEQAAAKRADREKLAQQEAVFLQQQETRRLEEERNLAVLNRGQEEQRRQAHTRQCTESVIFYIEDYVRVARLTGVQAEELRAAFMANVQNRNIVSPALDVWFADPTGKRPGGRDSRTLTHRAFTDADVQEPIVQCFLVAVRQFQVRLAADRQQQEREAALAAQQQEREAALAAQQQERDVALAAQQQAREAALARRQQRLAADIALQQQRRELNDQLRQWNIDSRLDALNSTLESIHRTQKYGF